MSKRKLLKKLSIGVASFALICPLVMSGLNNTNVNARRRHVRTHRVYKYHKTSTFHKGIPNTIKGIWYSHKKYINNHKEYYYPMFSTHFRGKNSIALSSRVYKSHGHKLISEPTPSDYWNPYWRKINSHTYDLLSGMSGRSKLIHTTDKRALDSKSSTVQEIKINKHGHHAKIWMKLYGFNWKYIGNYTK